MNIEEKKKLVEQACEGYIYEAENENIIRFSEETFLEYYKTIDDDFNEIYNYDLQEELNKMAMEYFENKGYKVYEQGTNYAYDGRISQVNAETAFVAIKE